MQERIKQIDKQIKELKEKKKNIKGTACETYARIVGYFRAVDSWNKGKREEYNDRKVFKTNKK